MTAPTLAADNRPSFLRRAMYWSALVFGTGALLAVAFDDTAPGSLPLFSGALAAWGWWKAVISPRRQHSQRTSFLTDPARVARLAAWRDGSALQGDGDELLEVPCTYYRYTASGAIEQRDSGYAMITRKALRLSGGANSREFNLKQLRGIEAKRDGVIVQQANGPHWVVAVADTEEFGLALGAAVAAAQGITLRVNEESPLR